MSEEKSRHPGSAVLVWWRSAAKDKEGFGTLTSLIDHLNEESEVRGRIFLKRLKTPEWKGQYGFRLRSHGHKPNRVKLEAIYLRNLVMAATPTQS